MYFSSESVSKKCLRTFMNERLDSETKVLSRLMDNIYLFSTWAPTISKMTPTADSTVEVARSLNEFQHFHVRVKCFRDFVAIRMRSYCFYDVGKNSNWTSMMNSRYLHHSNIIIANSGFGISEYRRVGWILFPRSSKSGAN